MSWTVLLRTGSEKLQFIESVGGTEFVCVANARDRGLAQTGPTAFELALTPLGWEQVAGLVEPFCEHAEGYQWLTDWLPVRSVGLRLLLSRYVTWLVRVSRLGGAVCYC